MVLLYKIYPYISIFEVYEKNRGKDKKGKLPLPVQNHGNYPGIPIYVVGCVVLNVHGVSNFM